jgi:hypothetical protein
MRPVTLVLVVAAVTTLAGCAGKTDASPDSSSADVTAVAPITLGNFINHPKIQEVRAEVAAVDAATLTDEKKDVTCDPEQGSATREKWTDASGKIRRLRESFSGEDGDGSLTWTYDASGRLRFIFRVLDTTPADGSLSVDERRVYFDATGASIWEVARNGRGTVGRPPNMEQSPYTKPATSLDTDTEGKDIVTNPAERWEVLPCAD